MFFPGNSFFAHKTATEVGYDQACSTMWGSGEAAGMDSKCQLESL